MRERTTWDRTRIANQLRRVAEDPRAMNQDHLQQQPAADAYVIGDPSDFAEDQHDETQNWKAEQGGDGNTSRNEIGMPEMRSDTFSHPEKAPGSSPQRGSRSAAEDVSLVTRRAQLCTDIATLMLKKGSAQAIEDQALAFMDLPDSQLMETFTRLAAEQEDSDDEEEEEDDDSDDEQSKEAGQQQDKKESQDDEDEDKLPAFLKKKDKEAAQQQDKKESQDQEDKESQDQEQDKKAKSKKAGQQQDKKESQDQEDEGQDKEAAQQQDKKESQDQEEGQDKEASAMAHAAAVALVSLPAGPARTAALKVAATPIFVLLKSKRAQMNQQGMQQLMSQVQQMIQQAMDQQLAQQQQHQQVQQQVSQQQQQPLAQQVQMSDEQLLDQLLQDDEYQLAGQQQQQPFAESEIQMDSPSMDVGDVFLGEDDAILSQVFASNTEVQEAVHAATLQGHTSPLGNPQGVSRTASTRTVGTRPTEGVSQLGGFDRTASSGGGEVSDLSRMWSSAPDVSDVFK